MIKQIGIGIVFFVASILSSCGTKQQIISDPIKYDKIEADFQQKKQLLKNTPEVFKIFDRRLTSDQRIALKFIYAYAPLSDVLVDPELYLNHVNTTLQAREAAAWKEQLTDELFLHFVLPPRVNNESIDSSRTVFYDELKDRVKGMSLKRAALEVNHWCHEKVIYAPSDARTSSPLSTVKKAQGRCGEESVFAVAALRAVGIPARQVYTPRWAHSDDNHAWVEIWGGDKWYYMGACEPEPMLDMGWFTGPAKRGVLMHSKAYGRYEGNEEIMTTTPCYTEINTTANYALTKRIDLRVVDTKGNPVPGATIEFKIYNYAEFYTVATRESDQHGESFITLGLGDLWVWAYKDGEYGYTKVSVPVDDTVRIVLDNKPIEALELDLVPPKEQTVKLYVTFDQQKENSRRLLAEDSIRSAYTNTFMSKEKAHELAVSLGLDTTIATSIILKSRGNYDQIVAFLKEAITIDAQTAMTLLMTISEKDLQDITAKTLISHLQGALPYKNSYDSRLFTLYILNPRIANETITNYRQFFTEQWGKKKTIEQIVELLHKIEINDKLNNSVAKIAPDHLFRLMIGDIESRNILFVALARSYGIPARLSPSTQTPQYLNGQQWMDITFDKRQNKGSIAAKGTLMINYTPIKSVPDPKYGTHFTISSFKANGVSKQINLNKDAKYDMGGSTSYKELFSNPIALDTGTYLLTSGTRMANGTVLSYVTSFRIDEGQQTNLPLVLRENKEDLFVLGMINPEANLFSIDKKAETTLLSITGRGYYLLALVEPNKEPFNHSIRAMSRIRNNLDTWGRSSVMVFKNQEQYNNFNPEEFGELPYIHFAIDTKGEIEKTIKKLNLNTSNTPIYLIADSFGRVVFIAQGYQINLADKLLKVINRL